MRDGLLLVDKQPGCTSHDVVQRARKVMRQRKMGHCGTLDPDATGLLVLTLGRATRLTRFLINAPKVYSGTVRFGVVTDTYDAGGTVLEEHPIDALTREAVEAEMERMVGTFAPPYSAKKQRGVKYYQMARRGEEVPAAHKSVTIYDFTSERGLEEDHVDFELSCTSGTYIRSVAHDLGRALGCGAHLATLRRLRVGPFEVAAALGIEEIARHLDADEPVEGAWVPFDSIPLPFAGVVTDAQQERRILHGQTVLVRQLECEEGDWIKLVNRKQEMIAVGTVIERIGESGVGVIQPRIVFRG